MERSTAKPILMTRRFPRELKIKRQPWRKNRKLAPAKIDFHQNFKLERIQRSRGIFFRRFFG